MFQKISWELKIREIVASNQIHFRKALLCWCLNFEGGKVPSFFTSKVLNVEHPTTKVLPSIRNIEKPALFC